ncbi:hypothetical protein SMKI_15G0020 [Saccharomyces mikatae IFO 1815]|uniref:YHL044W-like protein n=1 Tax=Saccharomyces mikatae IFO 1815 TaxID=226126 RepID=A0AA35NF29_SACMI|nr:uncharacterized protein SMKI_11G0020 [Saccharomyces mikatae IFO 1815]XP_056079284.1 uncharacterized protein SMKI_15G0020 [Saccharomyces mikatae IFO 1815]CAI4034557.1 hypothetical protein SMKI_11G0020 [Saccharomyces mikatae IFO 1815]CAI4036164.1 hypothetical protein SMKI_15G0020 [Saccharomyces mikatae IFO 1815]
MAESKSRPQGYEELFETEPIVLPRDTYLNWFSYFFKQHIQLFYFMFFHSVVVIVFGYITFHFEDDLVVFLACFFMVLGFGLLFFYIPLCLDMGGPKYVLDGLDFNCKMNLLVQVIEHKPSISIDTWNRIAYNMNQYAYEHHLFPENSLFYDGSSCYKVFRELAIVPCADRSSNGDNANINQKMKSDTDTSKTNKGYSNKNFELQSYIAKALAVYKESVNNYWAEKYPEVTI